MLHFDVKFFWTVANFIVKIDKNCYNFLASWRFLTAMAWKKSSLFSYDLLTTNTPSLVDVEVGRNCELS